jgi:zinc transport system substrate-binding protein
MGRASDFGAYPGQPASLVRFARENKVQYIFFEAPARPRLADTPAREIGARTLLSHPVEGVTRDVAAARKGYVSLMKRSLENPTLALKRR